MKHGTSAESSMLVGNGAKPPKAANFRLGSCHRHGSDTGNREASLLLAIVEVDDGTPLSEASRLHSQRQCGKVWK